MRFSSFLIRHFAVTEGPIEVYLREGAECTKNLIRIEIDQRMVALAILALNLVAALFKSKSRLAENAAP
jgi:hypothetical protein